MSTSTAFSSPTDSSGNDSSGGAPRGANYFFGFLITFVGLLIIFIICGIGSRRRLARRRGGLNDAFEPLGRFRKLEGGETRPEFYEPPLVVGEDKWSSLMPLSVRFCRENESDLVDYDLQPPQPPATPTPTSSPSHPRSHIFPSFNWFNHPKNVPLDTQADPEPPDTLQIAVMIAMPWDTSLNHQKSPDGLPEYQIGEVSFPWSQDVPHPNP